MARKLKNRDEVLKYILSTDFATGGYLPESKANKFITSIGAYSVLIGMARRVQLKQKDDNKIPKLHFTGPVSRGSTEDVHNPKSATAAPSELTLAAKKFEARVKISIDSLLNNIEFEGFENTFMDLVMEQISEDTEDACLNGDTTITGTDDVSLLRKQIDGWAKLSEGAHILDANGYTIQKDIWASMIKKIPKRYRKKNKTRLKFFCSDDIWMDWLVLNAGRADAIGMNAMNGQTISPFGYPIVPVPLFPDDLDIDDAAATSAWVKANRESYVKIVTGTNDKFKMDVDNGGAATVTLTAGVYTPEQMASHLNTLFAATYFYVDAFGRLFIKSTTTGAASEIDIQTVANNCYETLGFVVGVTTGAAAGSGYSHDGSFIWLTDPLNLIYGIFSRVRFNRRYDDEDDSMKSVWFYYHGCQIQELDMMVRCNNVKGRQLFG